MSAQWSISGNDDGVFITWGKSRESDGGGEEEALPAVCGGAKKREARDAMCETENKGGAGAGAGFGYFLWGSSLLLCAQHERTSERASELSFCEGPFSKKYDS